VRQMVRDLNFDIEIVAGETVRETDGLAMSSRNVRLSPADRSRALAVPRGIERLREAAAAGETDPSRLIAEFTREAEAAGGRVEYAELRHPETLEEVTELSGKTLFAVAVWFDDVRLIDNATVERGHTPRLAAGGER